MISTNDLRPGLTVKIDDQIHQVLDTEHVKPGKGPAYVQARLKNLITGAIVQERLRAGEKIPTAHLEKKRMQYLYRDGDMYYFMDSETYEQTPLRREQLEDKVDYLTENLEVQILRCEGQLIGVELPTMVDLEVVKTTPGLRGNTVSGGSKPAVLETGAEVQVPLFINEGDIIRVDTRDGEYVERAG